MHPWFGLTFDFHFFQVVVAIDPLTPQQAKAELSIKASVLPGCPPLWYPASNPAKNALGKLYMSNLALPHKVYKDVGISYTSPFGAKTCIPINLLESD